MWLSSSIGFLKTENPLGQLGFQEIDEEESGADGAQDRNKQRSPPALRENPFYEKEQEEKGGEGETEGRQEHIIDDQRKEGGQNPLL